MCLRVLLKFTLAPKDLATATVCVWEQYLVLSAISCDPYVIRHIDGFKPLDVLSQGGTTSVSPALLMGLGILVVQLSRKARAGNLEHGNNEAEQQTLHLILEVIGRQ